ncbi:MAG TPA: hypothetical protein VGR10_03100, partial [Thermoleophilaceae bacterium]|nr:hypothetical protein [Thermoleophilaceae bacterium]
MPAVEEALPRSPRGPLALTARFVGDGARRWLGGWVAEGDPSEAALADGGRGQADEPPHAIGALVVSSAPAGVTRGDVERMARAARQAGARIIGVMDGDRDPVWAGLSDAVLTDRPGLGLPRSVIAPRPVDPRAVNPIGFRQTDVAALGCLLPPSAPPEAVAGALPMLAEVAREEPVALLAAPGQAPA